MAGDGPAPEPQEAEDAAQDDASGALLALGVLASGSACASWTCRCCVCARDVGAWLVVVWSRGPTWMLMRDIWHSVEASVAKGPREGHEIQQVMPPPCSRHALLPLLRRDGLS